MPPNTPLTARSLLALVMPFGPLIEADELTFATDPPPDVEPLLAVLHTGVRALLSGRGWWATVEEGRAGPFTRVRVVELNPDAPLPAGTTLLLVEGDTRWDRIRPDARLDAPQLFAQSFGRAPL